MKRHRLRLIPDQPARLTRPPAQVHVLEEHRIEAFVEQPDSIQHRPFDGQGCSRDVLRVSGYVVLSPINLTYADVPPHGERPFEVAACM